MDAAERALLEETVRGMVAAASDAGDRSDGALADLGWLEMLEAEPRDAVEIVFTALGQANGVAGVLDDVLAAALGATPRADLAVLLPGFGRWDVPGREGLMTARAERAAEVLVVGADGIATAPIGALEVHAVRGADPAGGLHRARVVVPDLATAPLAAGAWDAAVAAGRRAVGHQTVGATRTALDLACTHARDRVQFGQAIGGFQAVRHRLADALVAIEALVAALGAAWDDGTPTTAALAKAMAGRSARTVAAQCQQVLAGIGFTTDHPFHLYLKRTMVLEGLFGTADDIVLDLGRTLVRTRRAPTLIEL
ncbi:MAG: acyl-CoA dehydrogenase family protein [Actinomycetota bacterium]